MAKCHTNRKIGDYVIYSECANEAPFFVRLEGAPENEPLSSHPNVTEAVKRVTRVYQASDKRRRA